MTNLPGITLVVGDRELTNTGYNVWWLLIVPRIYFTMLKLWNENWGNVFVIKRSVIKSTMIF